MKTSKSKRPSRAPVEIGGMTVAAGKTAVGELPVARLVTGTQVSLPVQVMHGRTDGPTVWISGAVHGDEIAGVEIIRRVMQSLDARSISGTLIAVPIVNVHGFLAGDRYLPDRRDLNRSFPGSAKGSLAARIANLFMTEIVNRCDFGIDFHTGSDHRSNLAHLRADLDDERTRNLVKAFGPAVMFHAKVRDGSLREAATQSGATVLLFEGGEAWRFDSESIRIGFEGTRRVLDSLGMAPADGIPEGNEPVECRKGTWVRARRSGIAHIEPELGQRVERRDSLGIIHDSVGKRLARITAPVDGIVLGRIEQPLVNQGDALIHIAQTEAK